MGNILHFLLRYSKWFVFVFYTVVSVVLLVGHNAYQQSVALSSANRICGSVYGAWSGVTGYFHLKGTNARLQTSNAELQNEVLNLKNEITTLKTLLRDSTVVPDSRGRYSYVIASVINNNTRHAKNFFTIDKGFNDGLRAGMGVADQDGVVGIVNVCGPHMSRVISLLNETQRFSVKLKDTGFIGSMSWKGGDPSVGYVEELPRHAKYRTGDTIVTSGYSTTFPEGIMVGTVLNRIKSQDDSFYTLKIKLGSDFKALSSVRVIKDIYKSEIDSLSQFDSTTGN